jgi:p-cumate 2,3-dioxygenase subunit alpha
MIQGGNRYSELVLDDRENGIFRVHRSSFVDSEILARERALTFDKSWLFAGHVSEFAN